MSNAILSVKQMTEHHWTSTFLAIALEWFTSLSFWSRWSCKT